MQEPKIKGGYILLSRRLIESEIFQKPPLYLKVWIYLLSRAQHKEYKKLNKGQLITNIPEIQDACSHYVGYRKVKPSKDQIYQILNWLRKGDEGVNEAGTKATMITTTKATQHILVTIDNYCFYQESKNYESNDESNDEKATRATREQRQPNNINKNDKNVKNDNNIFSSESNEFRLASYLYRYIKSNNPNAKEPNYEKWAKTFDYMLRVDKRDVEEIKQVIKFSQTDSFWFKNILSPDKLRKQYETLFLQMKNPIKSKSGKDRYSNTEGNENYMKVNNLDNIEKKLLEKSTSDIEAAGDINDMLHEIRGTPQTGS
ncbi:hypothetical protein [Rhodopseudomonas parapalustris]